MSAVADCVLVVNHRSLGMLTGLTGQQRRSNAAFLPDVPTAFCLSPIAPPCNLAAALTYLLPPRLTAQPDATVCP
jgi:hypothetical protein